MAEGIKKPTGDGHMKKAALWLSRHKMSGIKRRWIVNNMSIVVLLLAIMFIAVGAATTNYFYDSLHTSLQSRANSSAKNFSSYMSFTYDEFYGYAQQQITEFSDKDKMEMQVLDSNGLIISSSTGLVAGTVPATNDVNLCIETGEMQSFTGYDPSTEERIMAVTAPVFRKNSQDLIGEVRFVTSLKLLDRQVGQIYLMLAGAALAVLLLLTVTNQFFIHSIVNPVLKINELAQKIAQGQYGARLDMDFRDEMGELCNTINNMSTEIARMEKLKNDFISSVSHELRTPLTAIGGWAETVENNLDDKNTVETGLDIIRKETTRLSRMVEELLDFSRLESGRMKLQTEVLDLRGEVYDALFVYNEMLRQEGIETSYHEPSQPVYVSGDWNRLRQVFLNIIDNAAKYGVSGGKVEISIGVEEQSAVVRIRDYGQGIPADELPLVKEKFFKGSARQRGAGIGLAVCDEIVAMHDGSLDIDSVYGEGTTVSIRLPLAPSMGGTDETTTEGI